MDSQDRPDQLKRTADFGPACIFPVSRSRTCPDGFAGLQDGPLSEAAGISRLRFTSLEMTGGVVWLEMTEDGGSFAMTGGGGSLDVTGGVVWLEMTDGGGPLDVTGGGGLLEMTGGGGSFAMTGGGGSLDVTGGGGLLDVTGGGGSFAMTGGGGSLDVTGGVVWLEMTGGGGSLAMTGGGGSLDVTGGGVDSPGMAQNQLETVLVEYPLSCDGLQAVLRQASFDRLLRQASFDGSGRTIMTIRTELSMHQCALRRDRHAAKPILFILYIYVN